MASVSAGLSFAATCCRRPASSAGLLSSRATPSLRPPSPSFVESYCTIIEQGKRPGLKHYDHGILPYFFSTSTSTASLHAGLPFANFDGQRLPCWYSSRFVVYCLDFFSLCNFLLAIHLSRGTHVPHSRQLSLSLVKSVSWELHEQRTMITLRSGHLVTASYRVSLSSTC